MQGLMVGWIVLLLALIPVGIWVLSNRQWSGTRRATMLGLLMGGWMLPILVAILATSPSSDHWLGNLVGGVGTILMVMAIFILRAAGTRWRLEVMEKRWGRVREAPRDTDKVNTAPLTSDGSDEEGT